MALTPWTRQEEWYQQMINASTGNYLPSITAQDEGKVLTVESDGSWGVENVPSELPTVGASDKDKYLHTDASTGDLEWSAVNEVPTVGSSDKGKYLHSDASTGNVEWADAPTELPSVSGTDEGKVLTVNNSGVWVAANPSSGGGVLVVTDTDGTLDKTWQEIADALPNVRVVFGENDFGTVYAAEYSSKGGYYIGTCKYSATPSTPVNYNTESATGHPTTL